MALFSRKSKVPAQTVVVSSPSQGGQASPGGREARIMALGGEMLDRARAHKSGVFSAKFYNDAMMEWSMKDQNFKVQLFRFVDCFPMLKTPDAIFDHLNDYLSQPGVTVPTAIATLLKAGGLLKGTAAKTIASQIEGMAGKFRAGTDAAGALKGLSDQG
jgi:RHH-type proline utilization regulon transcriptional repressor/proline dehydrogenase/delta 1-pyrroline-5-carboxylate dehydrogenase